MNRSSTIWNIVFYVSLVAAAAGTAVLLLRPALAETAVLREKRDALVEQNRKLQAELHNRRNEIALLESDPEYSEKMARDQGKVRPGEIVFVIQESP